MTAPIELPPIAHPRDERLTWAQTRALIRSDLARIVAHNDPGAGFSRRAYYFLLPGMQALLWYRIARTLYLRGWHGVARLLSLVALYLTRAEIPPTTAIGPSALIAHATGVSVFGRVGARLTIQGDSACGGGFGIDDIGGGPGYPVLGDDVVLGHGAKVLGPVRVGNGVHVGPCALVTSDVADGALVLWPKPRIMTGAAAASDIKP